MDGHDGHMDGHWEWSEGGDNADTADLGGDDGGADLHGGYSADFGADEHPHGGYDGDGDDLGGHDAGHPGGDDLEEPLGTEHAAHDYDQSLHDTGADLDGGDGHPTFEPGHDTGHDTGHTDPSDASDHGDPAGQDGDEGLLGQDGHEAAFGTDPDVDTSGDDPAWHDVQFPEQLHLDNPPEPVDGFPWTDVDVLGGPDHSLSAAYDPAVAGADAHPEPSGLAAYAGAEVPPGGDPWALLLGSDDPATSSLAGFWAPQS